jgi:hypothetical protein
MLALIIIGAVPVYLLGVFFTMRLLIMKDLHDDMPEDPAINMALSFCWPFLLPLAIPTWAATRFYRFARKSIPEIRRTERDRDIRRLERDNEL